MEEYTTPLRCPMIQADKAYSRATNVLNFVKRLMSITGMNTKKRVDVFTLSIYKLVIFPKALGHIDDAVSDLFDRLDKRVTPVLSIFAETFRSLCACLRKVEKVSYRVFSENYSPLKEFVAAPKRDNIFEEMWMSILQNLQDEDFIPTNQGLVQCEFAYTSDNYKKKVCEISNAWNQTRKMKRLAANPMTTPEYDWWWGKRVNDKASVSRKNKAEEDLDSLKTDYKKQRLSMRTIGLGKTSEQWRKKSKKKILELISGKKIPRCSTRVAELERSLHQYCSRNFAIKLKASLNRIEELKGKIEELKVALQNCELQVELLEMNNEH
ncbi:hypothetical protein Gohar_003728 [Gossypium harknessii]|uniref:Uncharacterized protein n=1 Tax=Gossypium harknessii TaxID=34285 RepID=A0A7J9I962_9ROSI|nr:hypothetical protein [Gossypium harknessii]